MESKEFEYYIPLSGVSVENPFDIAVGLTMVNWSHVRPSQQKTLFENHLKSVMERNPSREHMPEAVIRTNATVSLFNELEFESLTNLCTLISGKSVVVLGKWKSAVDWSTNESHTGTENSDPNFNRDITDMELKKATYEPVAISPEDLISIYQSFQKMHSKDKNKINLVMNRVSSSLRRNKTIDRIIDIGIAMETLLMDGNKELKYRCAIRAAVYCGGTSGERQSTFELFKDTYDHRSKAVHEGEIEPSSETNVFRDYQIVERKLRQIVNKIIKEGSIPDWEKLVLGSDSPTPPSYT